MKSIEVHGLCIFEILMKVYVDRIDLVKDELQSFALGFDFIPSNLGISE